MKDNNVKLMASNGVYEVNVCTSFKNLNNVKSCRPLDSSTLNFDYKINSIHFISMEMILFRAPPALLSSVY
jgi:hypothetical protein